MLNRSRHAGQPADLRGSPAGDEPRRHGRRHRADAGDVVEERPLGEFAGFGQTQRQRREGPAPRQGRAYRELFKLVRSVLTGGQSDETPDEEAEDE